MPALLARRNVLQAGALTGGLAFPGLSAINAAAAPRVRPRPITGSIVGHLRLDPMRGGTIRLVERNGAEAAARDLARLDVPVQALYPGGKPAAGEAPLGALCAQALDLAIRVSAADWQVAPESCHLSGFRIVHPPSGRWRRYTAWVDPV